MTYCDKSVLASYCGNIKCEKCVNAGMKAMFTEVKDGVSRAIKSLTPKN